MSGHLLILALSASATAAAISATQQYPLYKDQQIVAMGHRAWIAKVAGQTGHTLDQLEDAERKFAWAQTLANEKTIKNSNKAEKFEHLQIMIENVTKSSFVIGDYTLLDAPHDHLYIAKSTSLAAITIRNILFNTPTSQKLSASETWTLLSETRKVHQAQSSQIEAFRSRKGGFDSKQLLHEYDRMGTMMKQTFELDVLQSIHQKQHYLEICHRLINLTLGKDPLPYKG